LIAQSLIAQDGFPKPILYNSDTVVAFTPEQVKIINYNKDSYDECVELSESLKKELEFTKNSLNHSREYEVEMSNKDRTQREIIAEKDKQIELHKDSNKKLQHKIKQSKVLRYIWTGLGTIGGFYLGNKSSVFIQL